MSLNFLYIIEIILFATTLFDTVNHNTNFSIWSWDWYNGSIVQPMNVLAIYNICRFNWKQKVEVFQFRKIVPI